MEYTEQDIREELMKMDKLINQLAELCALDLISKKLKEKIDYNRENNVNSELKMVKV